MIIDANQAASHGTDEFAYLAGQVDALNSRSGRSSVAVPVVERVTVDTATGSISALRFGTDTPAVVLLHGAGLNAHTWDTTVLALDLPALSIDLPGHGDSDWRSDADYSPAHMGPAVADAIAAFTDTPITLVGHSLGGMTAAWIAAHRPELVSTLLLVDITPGIDGGPGPAQLRAFYEKAEFPSRDAVVDWAQSFGMGGDRADTERGVFFNTRVREDGSVVWKHHFAELARHVLPGAARTEGTPALRLDTGWDDLAAVTAPITLVRGASGYINDAALAAFRERVPAAAIIAIDSGHNPQETNAAELADIVREVAA
ncbi:alpha/beta fold hydrolase [Microbacterium sp. GXS0129]|uniref:alpha/beta fold hydrolase n=1 Tax=Microbacterium sp. GXS0129 TaxID=3377836 RepID=UPI00383AAC44